MDKTFTQKFDEELSIVDKARATDYGHPADNFSRIAKLTAITNECKDAELRHVLYSLCVKIGRLIFSPTHFDSWLDVAGYARTAVMILDRRKELENGKSTAGTVGPEPGSRTEIRGSAWQARDFS